MKLNAGEESVLTQPSANKQERMGDASRQRWLRELENARGKMLDGTRVVKAADGGPRTITSPISIQFGAKTSESTSNRPEQSTSECAALTQVRVSHLGNSESPSPVGGAVTDRCLNGAAGERVILERLTTLMREEGVGQVDEMVNSDKVYRTGASKDLGEAWMLENIHLTNDENGVVVWLRDAAMDSGSLTAIGEKLRKGLADMGLRLSKIYLNGHPVVLETVKIN